MARLTAEDVLSVIRSRGVVRPRDLESAGISRIWLTRLVRDGLVERVGRGLYLAVGADLTEHHSLAEAATRVPHGVICLLSALSFHELTTQLPFQVWLAIDRKARIPKEPNLPIRVVRFSGVALSAGVEQHTIDGVPVPIFSAAKTVADCFRFRNKVGLDVAIEAMRDCYRMRLASVDEMWRFANLLRVANVMRPYLESLS